MIKLGVQSKQAFATSMAKEISTLNVEIGQQRKQWAEQTLAAIADLMPVWSGKTQNSINLTEGAPVTKRKLPWDWDDAYGPTNKLPLGVGAENMSNRSIITNQASKIKQSGRIMSSLKKLIGLKGKNMYITSASPAASDGLWEGKVPSPRLNRNPKHTLELVLTRGARATSFKR